MKLDEETKADLKTVVDHWDKEDRPVREQQLRRYRRLKLYWNSFSQIYWSESARDYRVYASDDIANSDNDQTYYDRPVNVFRAFLETVIAALSIQIPSVSCVPDDADNPNDLSTAKAGDIIAELLYKHNDVVYNWLQAMYVYYTEGMVAAYTYEKESDDYGTYKEKKYKDEEVESYICPHCQAQLDESSVPGLGLGSGSQQPNENQAADPNNPNPNGVSQPINNSDPNIIQSKNIDAIDFSDEQINSFGPDDDDIALHSAIIDQGAICPECGAMLDPSLQKTKLTIPRFVGFTDKPKSRLCMEIYGGLYVKIANYARKQEDTPYLIWSYETHYANVIQKYEDLWDEVPHGGWSTAGTSDPYEQQARLNTQYRNAFPENQVTVKNAWIRPAGFNILDRDKAEKYKKKFPDGAKVVMINTVVADAENEALDDCWTLTEDPMHDYVNHDAQGELLVNIQDIVNDLISLTLQTIEHGIIQTWADPAVVNFDAQGQIEAQPGTITAAKPQGGARNIGEAFFSSKAASLSPEIFQFYQIINQLGQFVSAAMPSIFGGSQTSGSSRTASEYAMSRTASLQRLQTPWRMFTIWWKNIFGKAIPAYMKMIKEDEKFVSKDDSGNFTNVWLRRAEMAGKIGSVELDASEQLPVSDEQKADIIMKLMELNNAEVLQALADPENLPFVRKIIKIPEFVLPGERDRNKQYEEIKLLLESQPIQMPPDPMAVLQASLSNQPPPQPQDQSSVQVDPIVDNHQIESATCRTWLVSEAGQLAKVENPPGYQNVLLHMKEHLTILTQQQQQAMQQQMQQAAIGESLNWTLRNSGRPPIGQTSSSANQQQQTPNQGNQQPKPAQSSQISGAQDARTPVQ